MSEEVVEDFPVESEAAEEPKGLKDADESEMANGNLKDTKTMGSPGASRGHGRSPGMGGGRGSYRGSRGGFRGGFRNKRGGGLNINVKNFDAKAMHLHFEEAISAITANEIMEYGRDAVSIGFGRGCTLHFKTPEEAKEMMEKIKGHKFCDLEPKVEHAYKKRVSDSEKRNAAGDESDASPNKKPKVEGQEAAEVKDKEEDEHDGKEEEEVEGEDVGDDEEAVGEEEVEGDEEMEGDEYGEGEEHLEGDYGEEAQDENEDEYEDVENPDEENEDIEDDQ